MNTLADVKRRAQPGVKLAMRYENLPHLPPPVRSIAGVQGNAIRFDGCDWSGGRESWLYWPLARDVEVIDADTFRVGFPGYAMVYTFITDERCPECGQLDNCGDCNHEYDGGVTL